MLNIGAIRTLQLKRCTVPPLLFQEFVISRTYQSGIASPNQFSFAVITVVMQMHGHIAHAPTVRL